MTSQVTVLRSIRHRVPQSLPDIQAGLLARAEALLLETDSDAIERLVERVPQNPEGRIGLGRRGEPRFPDRPLYVCLKRAAMGMQIFTYNEQRAIGRPSSRVSDYGVPLYESNRFIQPKPPLQVIYKALKLELGLSGNEGTKLTGLTSWSNEEFLGLNQGTPIAKLSIWPDIENFADECLNALESRPMQKVSDATLDFLGTLATDAPAQLLTV